MGYKHFVLSILVLIGGCSSKTTRLDIFYQKLDNTLSKAEKKQIYDCPDVGCLVALVPSQMRTKFADAYYAKGANIDQYLNDSFRIALLYDRQRAMFLAYQKTLAGKSVNLFEIKNELANYDRLTDSFYSDKEKRDVKDHIDTALINFNRFKIGDTLDLQFSIASGDNNRFVCYYRHYNKTNFKDTLFVKGILLEKTKLTAEQITYTHDEYFFSVRAFEVRNKNLNSVDKVYRQGNIISVPLYDYGRIINH